MKQRSVITDELITYMMRYAPVMRSYYRFERVFPVSTENKRNVVRDFNNLGDIIWKTDLICSVFRYLEEHVKADQWALFRSTYPKTIVFSNEDDKNMFLLNFPDYSSIDPSWLLRN